MTLKETFFRQASSPQSKIWQAMHTDQETLLALRSGSVAGVHVSGGNLQEKLAKEKEDRDKTDQLILQFIEASLESFRHTVAGVRARIGESRQYFQERINNLDHDEAEFQKNRILTEHGLEVYPDANDPTRYYFQDENGGWHELENEEYLQEAREIHEKMGTVKSMQNKQAFDEYKEGVLNAPAVLDRNDTALNDIERQVNDGSLTPDEGEELAKDIDTGMKERMDKLDTNFKAANENFAKFAPEEIKALPEVSAPDHEFMEMLGLDSENGAAPNIKVLPSPS